MPERYHINTLPTPARFPKIGKFSIVDWREDCARCRNCVKMACVSNVWSAERAYDRDPSTPIEPLYDCRACLSCVQGCTKGLLSLSVNPAYLVLGDRYWSKEMITTTWNQAETGQIPVSGAGYRGRFCGPGFDSMWTDMSEIVRPTRDGIHGREYISTSVDIGPKPARVRFAADGELEDEEPLVELPLPLVLDVPPWGPDGERLMAARVSAATSLHTVAVVRASQIADGSGDVDALVPLLDDEDPAEHEALLRRVRLVEIADGPDVAKRKATALALNPHLVVCVRMPFTADAAERVLRLYEDGVRVVHLCASEHGLEVGTLEPRFVRDALREVHGGLVQKGIRDEMTIIAGGGIALAEHMAKAIICGADLVAASAPLMVALGCRVCDGDHDATCPVQIQEVDTDYAARRMVNLMGAWHSQLIEVLGAMGIREVRRLRGETGRAMFLEDLDREAFGDIDY
ncbi:MAG: glutamate synthase-related protein [Dehalococcoidia bacterium]